MGGKLTFVVAARGSNRALDCELESVQSHDAPVGDDGSRDQAHPTFLNISGPDFDIQSEPAPMLNGVGAQSLHLRTRVFGIEANCLITRGQNAPGQPEKIVNSPRPD